MSDPFLIPSIISGGINALGSLGQGVINWFSQNENRKMQIDLANTAMQRRMEDLRKAGINPLMAGRLGGAETPTFQAPQMTGIENAVQQITPNAIQKRSYEMQQQQMNLNQTQAETARIQAERDKAIADAALSNTQARWHGERVAGELKLWGHQGTEIEARTQTINALREPQIQEITTRIAKETQETKTEEQRTIEMKEAAKNAEKLYKARASEAIAIAEQAATWTANFMLTNYKQKIDKEDIEIQLLRDKQFAQVIENILKNEYGRMIEWSKIFATPTSAAASIGAYKGNVVNTSPYDRKPGNTR